MSATTVLITSSTGLPPATIAPVRSLVAQCNSHDQTAFSLTLKPMTSPDEPLPRYLLAAQHGQIVGVAELIGYRDIEATILVAPAERRQTIGRQLANAVTTELAALMLDSWLLVCDEAFAGGPAFASALGGHRAYLEHRLILDPANVTVPLQGPLHLQQAQLDDATTIARVMNTAFGDTIDPSANWIAGDLLRSDRRWFCGVVEQQIVGCLRVITNQDGTYITAFGVLPANQGQGYGRAILSQTIALLQAEQVSPILIEVETDNATALGLYQSCGFMLQHTYSYYRVKTQLSPTPAPDLAHAATATGVTQPVEE